MIAKNKEIADFLKSKALTGTRIRKQVLALLWGNDVAMTQKELEKQLPQHTDRVTLYRTLKMFTEKAILHKIILDGETQKYKIAGQFRKNDHPHFYCSKCKKIICMPQLDVDFSALPDGFRFSSARVVVEGICNHCNAKNND